MQTTIEIRNRVNEKVIACIQKASERYGNNFVCPEIRYDIKGTTAGMANPFMNCIRLNPWLLAQNEEDFLTNTVPHEVAHLIAHKINRFCKAHGEEWKSVMRLFGLTPERCHSYDVSNCARRKTQKFSYSCSCNTYMVGAAIHRRIGMGRKYGCKKCGGELKIVIDRVENSASMGA